MRYSLLFLIFFALANSLAAQKYIRLYPQKKSVARGVPIHFSLFIKEGEQATVSVARLNDNQFNDYSIDPFALSFQDKIKKINIASLKTVLERQYTVKEGANYLDLKQNLASGYYLLIARLNKKVYSTATIAISNLGIITKQNESHLLILTSDLKTGRPSGRAEVFLGLKNKQAGLRFKTDSKGLLKLDLQQLKGLNLDRIQIRARKGKDVAQVFSGFSAYQNSRYQVFIDTDRPVYKPGHRVNWFVVARKKQGKGYRPVKAREISVQVVKPGGNELEKVRAELDSFGKASGSFHAPKVSGGFFSIVISLDNEHHQADVLVKDYVKPSMLVKVNTDHGAVVAGSVISGSIKARYLFGEAVSGGPVTYQVYRGFYSPPPFRISSEERFFDLAEQPIAGRGELVTKGSGVLDESGEFNFKVKTEAGHRGSVYTIRATVAESDEYDAQRGLGSTSIKVLAANITLNTRQENFIIKPSKTEIIRAKVRNLDDSPAALVDLTLGIYRQKISSLNSAPGKLPQAEYDRVDSKVFKSSKRGNAIMAFSIREQGYYKLVISANDKQGNVVRSSLYYWVAKTGFKADSGIFAEVNLKAGKRYYRPGETARLVLTSSIKNAHVLLTAEGDRLHWHKMIRLKGNLRVFDFKLDKESYLPNIYLTASIVYNGRLLTSALPVFISPRGRFIKLKFKRDKKRYRPGDTASITVTATDSDKKPVKASLAIAVVDEAVHLVQSRLSPSIQKFFYGRKPNRTRLSYSFPQVFTGGDAKDDTPPDADRSNFKDTAYFNAAVETNSRGQAEIKVKLPGNLTTWRLTATAVDQGSMVGSGNTKFISTKKLLARLSVPRFLNTSSKGTATAIVHNTSDKPMKITTWFQARGLTLENAEKQSSTLGPRQRKSFVVKIAGKEANPKAYINFYVEAKGVSDSLQKFVPVVETGIDHVLASPAVIMRGEKNRAESLARIDDAILKRKLKAREYELIVNPNLVASLLNSVDYMLEYPHGCVEQTTNKFLPNLVVMKFLKRHNLSHQSLEKKLKKNVDGGIKRLLTLQNKERGGWGWWQSGGGYSINHWMTAYALYGLLTARDGGYNVDQAALQLGLKALRKAVYKAGPGRTDSIDRFDDRQFAAEESFILFANHVLTMAGQGDASLTDAVIEMKNDVTLESIAWAATTLVETKDRPNSEQLREAMLARSQNGTSFEENFSGARRPDTSPVYYSALASAASFGLQPVEKDFELLMSLLKERSYDGRFVSTRDTAASIRTIMAFLDTHKEYLHTDMQLTYTTPDSKEHKLTFDKNTPLDRVVHIKLQPTWLKKQLDSNKPLQMAIKHQGRGLALAYLKARVFEPTDKFAAIENGISVQRRYMKEGQEEDSEFNGVLYNGDAVNVEIKVKANRGSYLFVTEKIPPGFVVESDFDYSYGSSNVIVLKDRIYFYLESYHGSETLRYTLRAINSGAYLVPPTRAEFMYNDTVNGSSASEVIKVE